jgi:hypothetical protein
MLPSPHVATGAAVPLMGGASLPRRAVTAFRSAGATEEMIARARLIFGSLPREAAGRPRMYKNRKEADHAFYVRKRDREKIKAISSNNGATQVKDAWHKYADAVSDMLATKPLPGADRLNQAAARGQSRPSSVAAAAARARSGRRSAGYQPPDRSPGRAKPGSAQRSHGHRNSPDMPPPSVAGGTPADLLGVRHG